MAGEVTEGGTSNGAPRVVSESSLRTLQSQLSGTRESLNTEQASELHSTLGLSQEEHHKLREAHYKLYESHNATNQRLNEIERRLQKVEDTSGSDTDSDGGSDFSDVEDDYTLGYEEVTIPEVRDVNFEQFKNRYTDKDGKYCIEVLIAGSNFEEQVRQELKRRGELDRDDAKPRANYDESDEHIIHRVRIQSPAILWLMHQSLNVDSVRWKGQNRTTFYRPFAWFMEIHENMTKKLQELEDHFSAVPITQTNASLTIAETVANLSGSYPHPPRRDSFRDSSILDEEISDNVDQASTKKHRSFAKRIERDVLEQAFLENYHTLLELRCYVDFVTKRILPHASKFKDPSKPEARMVRYQDLWYLFQSNDLVYNPTPFRMKGEVESRKEELGRICWIDRPDATSLTMRVGDQTNYLACQPRKSRESRHKMFGIMYVRLDFDGESYGTINQLIHFPYFDDLRDVTTLPIYPIRFKEDSEKLVEELRNNGKRFRDAIKMKHMVYGGWSRSWAQERIAGARPGPEPPGPGQKAEAPTQAPQFLEIATPLVINQATYIESDVIIDIKEAFRAFPQWQFSLRAQPPYIASNYACQDSIEILKWSDKQRSGKAAIIQDRTQDVDCITYILQREYVDTFKFSTPQKDPEFEDEDLLLLPRRVFGYALRERKFFQADVQYLRPVQTEANSFENLKINPAHIHIVNSVVSSHFQRKQLETLPEFLSIMDQDLIRGKGRGLVILLHGAPGVGKTATAEAVALAHDKPLFVITCGDLGFTPREVESSLSDIFRLAHLWNCILLLDEADVFLSQREANALQRNALVSVFLRILEYYNGILFLTTNRVGTLDEAFKSRVHLSLYYPPLNKGQTEEIIRMNLKRLKSIEEQRSRATGQKAPVIYEDKICKFAVEHWERHAINDGQGRWNGRQIRNAVQIAASLAWYERKVDKTPGTEDLPPILDETHFRTVENTMSLFEGYMTKAKGGTDVFISHQRAERYDNFQNPSEQHGSSSYTHDPPSSSGANIGGYHPYPIRERTPQQAWYQQPQMPVPGRPLEQFRPTQATQPVPSGQNFHPNAQHMMHDSSNFAQAGGRYGTTGSIGPGHLMDQNAQPHSGTGENSTPASQYSQFEPQSSYTGPGSMPTQAHGGAYMTGNPQPTAAPQAPVDHFTR